MKAEFNINCPLSFSLYDIELYCGINQYVITNLGIRRYKYSKTNIKNSIVKKIEYIIKNEKTSYS